MSTPPRTWPSPPGSGVRKPHECRPHLVGQVDQLGPEADDLVVGQRGGAPHLFLDGSSRCLEPGPGLGQLHVDHPPVGLVLDPANQVGRFQAGHDGRHGVGGQVEPLGDLPDGARAVLPQDQQHQVLGVGQPDLVEQGAVDPGDGVGGGVEGEAKLIVEPAGLVARLWCPG